VILKLDPYSDFRIREIAANHLLHGSRVLDVGCGRGQVLAMFRQLGALVSGIDLDPSAVEFCRDALGIQDVCHGSFADLGGDRKYDIILMLDFIEHPIDPMASLESAASLLNDGGIIAIWTPNAAAARDSDDPVFMRVDLEHMQYLDFRTCHHIAGKLGLCVVHLEGVGHPSINDMLGTDLDKPVRSGCSASVRRLVRKIPGCSRLRRMLKGRHSSESSLSDRLGNYHLFCIMRRGT
jgi:SAM-dependent methyltransferase